MTKESRSENKPGVPRSGAPWFAMMKALTGPTAVLFLGCVLLCRVDQTVDCMRTLVADLGSDYLIFQAFVFWWAAQTWYAARTLLHLADFPENASETVMLFQRWLPRLLGAAVFIIVGYAYVVAAKDAPSGLTVILPVHALLFTIFLVFVLTRRRLFRSKPLKRGKYEIQWTDCRDLLRNWKFIVVSAGIFLILFLAFVLDRVFVPQLLGAPAIALSALSFWGILFIWINDIDSRTHVPVLFLLLSAVTVFSFINNNHSVRLLPENSPRYEPPLLEEYFETWIAKRLERSPGGGKVPVVVIAAEGGGMRSAYWTARLLSVLEEKSGYRLGDRVFALSGVSGGSLGLSAYLSLLASGRRDFPSAARSFLETDLLSPVAASAFYTDFLQRFLPFPVTFFDRARPFELALEAAWKRANPGGNQYSDPLYSLWYGPVSSGKPSGELPAVFFNATRIENGRRVVIGNTVVGNDFADAVDLAGEEGPGGLYRMRLSTAVLLSARFPFVTPAARLYDEEGGGIWGHLGDGGYFENSGTATAYDLLSYLGRTMTEELRERIFFHVLVLTNDAGERGEPSDFLYEASQPAGAFFNAWTARTPYSIRLLSDAADGLRAKVYRFNLDLGNGDVPLGWTLSERAMDEVDSYVDALFADGGEKSGAAGKAGAPGNPLIPAPAGVRPPETETRLNAAAVLELVGAIQAER